MKLWCIEVEKPARFEVAVSLTSKHKFCGLVFLFVFEEARKRDPERELFLWACGFFVLFFFFFFASNFEIFGFHGSGFRVTVICIYERNAHLLYIHGANN